VRTGLLLGCALLLVACDRNDAGRAVAPAEPANPLEAAAREANLVADAASDPTGLYERQHAAGVDGVCLVRAGADPTQMRFGMIARFGPTLHCQGRGEAVHQGASIRFNFAAADCTFEARYDGNSVQLPGRVPAGCAALCGPRASFSGVAVERTGWTARDALRLRAHAASGDAAGAALCGE